MHEKGVRCQAELSRLGSGFVKTRKRPTINIHFFYLRMIPEFALDLCKLPICLTFFIKGVVFGFLGDTQGAREVEATEDKPLILGGRGTTIPLPVPCLSCFLRTCGGALACVCI